MPRNSSIAAPSRRQFLKVSTAAASALFAAPAIVRGTNLNEKLDIAIIGCGGRGAANLQGVSGENIVALCDVNAAAVEAAAKSYPQARKLADFRHLFDHADEFDAVVVITCEHTHAYATLPALKMKKHVYCEKPLAYNVHETRLVREAAAEAKVATQMGTQIHAEDNFRRVVELIKSGAIGPVREVHVWVSRAWGWHPSLDEARKNGDIVAIQDRPAEEHPVPSGLNWDLWLGPAPERPFNNVYVPGPKWYRWWDFGNGSMSDLGSHRIDLPFWALDLHAPLTIEAEGPPPHPDLAPASMKVTFEYAARGEQPPVKLHWYQGAYKPERWANEDFVKHQDGILFEGDEGMVISDYFQHALLPEEKFADFQRPPQTIPKSLGHYAEWIHACKTGAPTTCNFEYAGWLTEANHLGNVAFRTGKKLHWDAVLGKAINAPEAEQYLRREPRAGWSLA